jgi:hypothetical protein
VLRFANTIMYLNEYNLCDCLRPRDMSASPSAVSSGPNGSCRVAQTEGSSAEV